LVPVRADKYSVLGLELLHEFVESIPTILPKPEFIVALNGVPRKIDAETASIESQLRAHAVFGSRTMATSLNNSSHLRAKTDYTGFATDKRGSWTGILRKEITAFADELAKKLGV
jgi:chromosome partitioning protein